MRRRAGRTGGTGSPDRYATLTDPSCGAGRRGRARRHGRNRNGAGRRRAGLVLVDLRRESDYNLFHLGNARRHTLDELAGDVGKALAGPDYANAFKVLMAQDERAAEAGWRILKARGATAVYVLAGGVDLWLRMFRDGDVTAQPGAAPDVDATMRHAFTKALGDRYVYALPPFPVYERLLQGEVRSFEFKITPIVAAPTASSGCG